jgi:3-methyladenine DNA glycosylase/8-oxoguanine DNA glycosylase
MYRGRSVSSIISRRRGEQVSDFTERFEKIKTEVEAELSKAKDLEADLAEAEKVVAELESLLGIGSSPAPDPVSQPEPVPADQL